jgi:UDP-galactopyranose mutase
MLADFLVVGAGFAGSICAQQLADAGHTVVVVDRREHIGGNAYDEKDEHGITVHRYGPHIFHTNSKRIFDYLSQFTEWAPYEHRVLSSIGGRLYPFPINRDTINRLYDLDLDEAQAETYFNNVREARSPIRTSEDVVLNSVGRDLYEKFFLNYTRKQWGVDPSQLKAGVAARIPVRINTDDRYFTDTYQAMPKNGYTKLFSNLLDHPNIRLELGTRYEDMNHKRFRHLIYTGAIDDYFDHCYGPLPYRSLRFEHEHIADVERFQPVATVNYPNDHAYTRITEFKHVTGERHRGTSIVREYPATEGEPYYPVPSDANELLFKKYETLAAQQPAVTFVGRLAQYRYYNMDQVVAAALTAIRPWTAPDNVGQ